MHITTYYRTTDGRHVNVCPVISTWYTRQPKAAIKSHQHMILHFYHIHHLNNSQHFHDSNNSFHVILSFKVHKHKIDHVGSVICEGWHLIRMQILLRGEGFWPIKLD